MGFGFCGGLFGIIPLLLICFIIYAFANRLNGNNTSCNHYGKEEDALEILKQRFARGEITEEEYKKKKDELLK